MKNTAQRLLPRWMFAAVPLAMTACLPAGDSPMEVVEPDVPLTAAFESGPGQYVLNTQIRGIIDPDVTPSPAYGHLQVKLTDLGDGTFQVDWKGKLFNPAGETFTLGTVGIIDPDVEPPPGTEIPLTPPPIMTFFRGASVNCGTILFDSKGIINPEIITGAVANNWIINPDVHEARFNTTDLTAGAVAGLFGPATTEGPAEGQSGGSRVRCEA